MEHAQTKVGAAEFAQYAKCLMLGKGDLLQAQNIAQGAGIFQRVTSVIKGAVAVGSTTDSTWASGLYDNRVMAEAFAASLRGLSAFDTIAAASWRAPLATRIAATVTAATGSVVAEGAPMPITKMGFAATTLAPHRVVALCAVSAELLRGPFAERFLDAELRGAVATASDAAFVTAIATDASSSATAGAGSANALKDIRTLLDKVNAPGAVPFLILGSTNANALATADGTPFAKCTPAGGEVAGVPYIVSAAAPTKALAVDARSLLTGDDLVTLDSSGEATLQLDSAPDNPATASTTLVSLWQENLMGLLASRMIGFEVIRPAGVAVVTGAAW